MEYRTLGKTGLRVSRLGCGGIPIQRIDAEGTRKLMHRLLAEGVNFVDTARGYTVSEEYLGYGLEGIREHFVLATKSHGLTWEEMEQDVKTSLKNLRTDYIDLYQFHNPTPEDLAVIQAPGGALEYLQEAKKQGIVRHIGLTLHSADMFREALECPWVETLMFPYNIVESQGTELIKACGEKNIGFLCMKPLAGGAIEDATLAIRYIAQNPDVTVVLPGMASEEEAAQNLAAIQDTSPLTIPEQEKIQAIRSTLGTQFCRRCGYCAPCPNGIDIPSNFLMANYARKYGLAGWAEQRYKAMPYHAGSCVMCGACEKRCPYGLPIRDMLEGVAKVFGY